MTSISPELIENLQNNGVVVYPTTTLPGLGCLPNKLALDNLYNVKNRPAEQPVSLGVADLEHLRIGGNTENCRGYTAGFSTRESDIDS